MPKKSELPRKDALVVRYVRWIAQNATLQVLLVCVTIGAGMLGLSFVVGVDSTEVMEKHVGYKTAPNWGLGFSIMAPFAMYFLFLTMRHALIALQSVANDGMLVDDRGERYPNAVKTVEASFYATLHRYRVVATFLMVALFVEGIVEWYHSAGRTLLFDAPLPRGFQEYDWTTAAVHSGSGVAPVANALFGLGAYAMQGVFVAHLLLFVVFLLAYCDTINHLSDNNAAPFLVPDFAHVDSRLGFERFERMAEDLVLACVFAFTHFYLSVVWNIFLTRKETSFTDFVTGDLMKGFAEERAGLVAIIFDVGPFDFSRTMVTVGALILFPACGAALIVVLRRAALQSRHNAAELFELDGEKQARLAALATWPLSYPPVNMLILLVVLAALSLLFFRIGLVYAGAFVGAVLVRALALLKPRNPIATQETP